MPLLEKILNRFNKSQRILGIALCAVFLISMLCYFIRIPGRRYVFRFESVDSGKTAVEYRILPRRKGYEKIVLYVDELLLGPKTERSRPIFSLGTTQTFCFVREKILYVNLTSELLYRSGNASEILDGIALFKANILKEFPALADIELYIDEKPVLEEI